MMMAYTSTVSIVMATFNGVRFVRQQIESIRAQSWQDWRLFVRDDGSDDGTVDVLREFAARDTRITIVDRESENNLGPSQSFERLLERACDAGAQYVFLSDQDDVWHEDKLALMVPSFDRSRTGPDLVYSDMEIASSDLTTTSPSFIRDHFGSGPKAPPLARLLVQNFVPGCASAVHRELIGLALPFPRSVRNHDWWLAVCAAAAGRLIYVDRPLSKYRQHEGNVVGTRTVPRRASETASFARAKISKHTELLIDNASALERLDERLRDDRWGASSESRRRIGEYVNVIRSHSSAIGKLWQLRRLGFWPVGVRRQMLFVAAVARLNRVAARHDGDTGS